MSLAAPIMVRNVFVSYCISVFVHLNTYLAENWEEVCENNIKYKLRLLYTIAH